MTKQPRWFVTFIIALTLLSTIAGCGPGDSRLDLNGFVDFVAAWVRQLTAAAVL